MHSLAPVLVTGTTGTGKSSSIGQISDDETGQIIHYGLPPKKTLILNPELQAEPVDNFADFNNIYVHSFKENTALIDAIIKIKSTPKEELEEKRGVEIMQGVTAGDIYDCQYLVYDSLTSLSEMIERHCKAVYDKWTAFDEYALALWDFLNKLKKIPMQVFVMGIPEPDPKDINNKMYFKVAGQKMRWGQVEKEFNVVLFTNPTFDDQGYASGVEFMYRMNRANTAKAPGKMFQKGLPNDLFLVAQAIKEFAGEPLDHDERRGDNEQAYRYIPPKEKI